MSKQSQGNTLNPKLIITQIITTLKIVFLQKGLVLGLSLNFLTFVKMKAYIIATYFLMCPHILAHF